MPLLSRKGIVTLIVLGLGLLMIVSLAMLKSKPQREPRTSRPLLPVDVLIVVPAPLTVTVLSQGTVAPKREIDLVSQVAGRVVAVAAQYGDMKDVDRAMAGWDQLSKDPSKMQEVFQSFKDPEVMAKAQEMLKDPVYMEAAKRKVVCPRKTEKREIHQKCAPN